MMKERPILFSAPMVKAILDDTKGATRRIMKVQPPNDGVEYVLWQVADSTNRKIIDKFFWATENGEDCAHVQHFTCPYGSVGDRLWVRETWYYEEHMHDLTEGEPDIPGGLYSHRLVYRADCPEYPVNVGVGKQGWRPSIFMPRWASRITLEITGIRVDRLQDITEEDAIAEGIHLCAGIDEEGYTHGYHWGPVSDTELLFNSAVDAYRKLWDAINGKKDGKTWKDNPWVWVVEFRRVEG